jgi:hypothetical protein
LDSWAKRSEKPNRVTVKAPAVVRRARRVVKLWEVMVGLGFEVRVTNGTEVVTGDVEGLLEAQRETASVAQNCAAM